MSTLTARRESWTGQWLQPSSNPGTRVPPRPDAPTASGEWHHETDSRVRQLVFIPDASLTPRRLIQERPRARAAVVTSSRSSVRAVPSGRSGGAPEHVGDDFAAMQDASLQLLQGVVPPYGPASDPYSASDGRLGRSGRGSGRPRPGRARARATLGPPRVRRARSRERRSPQSRRAPRPVGSSGSAYATRASSRRTRSLVTSQRRARRPAPRRRPPACNPCRSHRFPSIRFFGRGSCLGDFEA